MELYPGMADYRDYVRIEKYRRKLQKLKQKKYNVQITD